MGRAGSSDATAVPVPPPFVARDLVEALRAGRELSVHVARRDGRLVGAAPLVTRSHRSVRVARFLGGRQSALADLLLAADAEPEVAKGSRAASRARTRPTSTSTAYPTAAASRKHWGRRSRSSSEWKHRCSTYRTAGTPSTRRRRPRRSGTCTAGGGASSESSARSRSTSPGAGGALGGSRRRVPAA